MPAKPTPSKAAELGEFCGPFKETGQPAISGPGYCNADEFPIGVQLVADYGREELPIALASPRESVHPWVHGWQHLEDSIKELFMNQFLLDAKNRWIGSANSGSGCMNVACEHVALFLCSALGRLS